MLTIYKLESILSKLIIYKMCNGHMNARALVYFFVFSGLISMTKAHAVVGTRVVDVVGNIHQIGLDNSDAKESILVFVSPNCDSSQTLSNLLSDVAHYAKEKNHSIYAVISDNTTNWNQAIAFAEAMQLAFPLILDTNRILAGALTTPLDAQVFDISGQTIWSGSIASILKQLGPEKGSFDTVVANNEPVESCLTESGFSDFETKPPTYNRNIAPIINANCSECHRENGVAPFALDSYQQVRKFAPVITYVTEKGIMPPWNASKDSGHYLNERILSLKQKAILKNWAQTGTPEGNLNDTPPKANLSTSGWRLGEPDIVIEMPESFSISASGPDVYRYFVVEDAIPDDLEIAAIDFKPGDASVVHHSNFFVDYGQKARALDKKDPQPGFSVFGTGGLFSYWDTDNSAAGLGAWAPGGNAIRYPDGMGIKLPGGADFVFEIHYHPTGKNSVDRSQLAIYLSKKPIKQEVSALFMGTDEVVIPAGTKNYQRHVWMELPEDIHLVDIAPHMHYLGKTSRVTARLPDSSEQILLEATWDFRWQNAYYFRKPMYLPKGTRIDAYFSYDNSSNNPYNPYDPPVTATWGWGSDQEMGELYLTVLAKNKRQLKKLQNAAFESWFRTSDPVLSIAPLAVDTTVDKLTQLSIWEPRAESLIRTLSSDPMRFKQAISQLKVRAKQSPDDAKNYVLLGALYGWSSIFNSRHLNKWQKSFDKALDLDPSNWDALYALASGYADTKEQQYHPFALPYFEQLLDLQRKDPQTNPLYLKTYQGLGELYEKMGKLGLAKTIWGEGLQRYPEKPYFLERLGLNTNVEGGER
jgi:tetratricopeptide (TPR) repeat protein